MKLGQRRDLTGTRYGRLVVIGEHHRNDHGTYFWECVCDCGGKTVVSCGNLKRGTTKSCGCLARENKPPVTTKHGNSRSKLYKIWVAMRQRCLNPNDANYHRYGGRGITVCDEWLNDFKAFYDWSMANGYVEGKLDLDRTDNNKGYCPENCRFVSHRENLKNTHRKLHDVIKGEDITLSDAAIKYGFEYGQLYQRYKRGKRGDELIEHRNNHRNPSRNKEK